STTANHSRRELFADGVRARELQNFGKAAARNAKEMQPRHRPSDRAEDKATCRSKTEARGDERKLERPTFRRARARIRHDRYDHVSARWLPDPRRLRIALLLPRKFPVPNLAIPHRPEPICYRAGR